MVRMCDSTVFGLRCSRWQIPRLDRALGHQREHLTFAIGEQGDRPPPRIRQKRHDLGTDRAATGGHPPHRVDELRDPGHPLLEQVPDATRVVTEQGQQVTRLQVLGQQQAHARVAVA
jgi:hypothetical protein